MVAIKLKNDYFIVGALIIVFTTLLYLGYGPLSGNQIQHEFPFGYLASDAFQHQTRADWIADQGNYRHEAPYIQFGFEEVVGFYPPMVYHVGILIANLSGIPVHDAVYFGVFFLVALGAIAMYFVIAHFSRDVALLSLPLSIIFFHGGLYTGFTFGHWPSLMSQVFMVLFLWTILNIDKKGSWFFLGVAGAGMVTAHTSEAIFAGLIFAIYLVYSYVKKEPWLARLKTGVFGGIFAGVLSLNTAILFNLTWMQRQPYEFTIIADWGQPTMFIGELGWLLALFAIGIIGSFLFLKAKNKLPLYGAVLLLILSYTNYAGFSLRAFQLRYFWPVYLGVLMGAGIYIVMKLMYKKWKVMHSFGLMIILLFAFATPGLSFIPSYTPLQSQGLMDPFHWEVFTWIANNAAPDAVVGFFYGDVYNQDAILRNGKRVHYELKTNDYIEKIQSGQIQRSFLMERPGDHGGGIPNRTSFFSVDFLLDSRAAELKDTKDICDYDILVFDKQTRQPAFAQYNMALANTVAQFNHMRPVVNNAISVVFENTKPGDECFEQHNVTAV